jgi:hypothetical protein
MISDIFKVAGAAIEYGGAAKAMTAALKKGKSLEFALRAFAAETESEIDDGIVDGAIEAIEALESFTRTVAVKALTASLLVEQLSNAAQEKTPELREGISKVSTTAAEIAEFLDGLQIRD